MTATTDPVTPRDAPLTPLDDSYTHQLVGPRAATEHADPNWQERCYHLLFAGDDLILDMGRAVWPHAGVHRAFLGAADGSTFRTVRTEVPFRHGDDPDAPDVDGLVVETVRPLEEIRLRYGAPGDDLAVDLTWTARFPAVTTTPHRIEQDGRVVTHYINFFQTGLYDGWVELGGRRRRVEQRAGFRDRGWGLRKHEGAPRRGLVLSVFCELADEAIYLILFETASGRRVLSNGWSLHATGEPDLAVEIEHDVRFDGVLMRDGVATVTFASGRRVRVAFETQTRLFLAGVGYSPLPERQAPGRDTFDISDPGVVASLEGQTDHGCVFEVDGMTGHGYVETGLGVHARYRPAPEG